MSNLAALGFYTPLLITQIIICLSAIIMFIKTRRNGMFIFLCFCVIGWLIIDMAILFVKDLELNIYIWNIGLIFVGFSPLATFLVFFRYYLPERKIPPYIMILLFIIPSLNALVALTSYNHDLLRTVNIISISPVRIVEITWGVWFWVHTAFSYVFAIAGAAMLVYGYRQMPKFYRLPSALFIIAFSVMLAGNLVFLLEILPTSVDPTGMGAAIAGIFMFFALYRSNQSIFNRFAKGQVFDYLDEIILVLSRDKKIEDFNASARLWFSSLGIDPVSCLLPDILDTLKQKGAVFKGKSENEDGQDISFTHDGITVILNLRLYEMTDKKAKTIGTIAIFTNVTQNRILLERIEKKAGMDHLTGIANRLAYDGAKERLNTDEYMPLSVIVCDANGLKQVNDTLGHKYGDLLLQAIAEVFEKVLPKSYFVARIGGDEYIFLLPCTDLEGTHRFMDQIREALANRDDLPFVLSVAMGAATKHKPEENFDDVIALADQRMYEDKKRMKGEKDLEGLKE
ncbi:MAG: diguanylate cyclase [Oscillospiraceae bacterium]|nr:diguanylate cyclase [Oscillospiraceae bacterium]